MYRTIIKPTLILVAIAFIASFALSHVNKITKLKIEERIRLNREEALLSVLPASQGYVIIEKDKKAVVDGKDFFYSVAEKTEGDKKTRAYAFEAEKGGYSGVIRSIVAVDETMKLLGISIVQQSETPGLGARAKEIASSDTFISHFFGSGSRDAAAASDQPARSWFEAQFAGIDAGKQIGIMKKGEWRAENTALRQELLEKNSVSALTGATITTKAVIAGIEIGISRLRSVLEQEKTAASQEVKAK